MLWTCLCVKCSNAVHESHDRDNRNVKIDFHSASGIYVLICLFVENASAELGTVVVTNIANVVFMFIFEEQTFRTQYFIETTKVNNIWFDVIILKYYFRICKYVALAST